MRTTNSSPRRVASIARLFQLFALTAAPALSAFAQASDQTRSAGLTEVAPIKAQTDTRIIDARPFDEFFLETATVEHLKLDDVLALPTSTGDTVRMRVESIGSCRPGTRVVTFVGDSDLLSSPFASATIVVRDGLVGGIVRPDDGFEISLAAIGPGHQGLRINAQGSDSCGVGNGGGILPEGGVADDCQESPKLVDVAFIYTQTAASFWGSAAALELQLEVAIIDANNALKNCGVVTRLRLVRLEGPISGNADSASFALGTLPEILDAMKFGDVGNTYQQLWYTTAHVVRDTFGADLVQAIVSPTSPSVCGLADIFDTNPENGYSTVDAACLGDFTPAHEFGHGFGACHATGDGGGCEAGGYYPYSNGFRFTGLSGAQWRTVMAYPPGQRIPMFSTASKTWDGVATGIAGNTSAAADNMRTIALTASSVANFRCATDPLVDCNGNGDPDALDILNGVSGDCNGNAVPDECDIASGFLTDVDLNGIPDECEAGEGKIVSPDVAGEPVILDSFGISVSVGHRLDQVPDAAAYLVVGANGDDQYANNSGAAYIIPMTFALPTGSGVKLKASDSPSNPNSQFGRSVAGHKRVAQASPAATARSFAAVGAFRSAIGAHTDQGAVYVYAEDASVWSEKLKLKASDGQTNDWFGFSTLMTRIGLDNFETIVVGAPRASGDKGAVYLYRYQLNDTTVLSKKLLVPFSGDGDQFGWSIAIDNDAGGMSILLAGAPGYGEDLGRVRAYERGLSAGANFPSTGASIFLSPAESTNNDRFGEAVAVEGSIAVIGAPGKDTARGAVYYFERTGLNAWSQRQKITLPTGFEGDRFGASVSLLKRSDGSILLFAAAPKGDGVTVSGPQTNLGILGIYKYNPLTNAFDLVSYGATFDAQSGDESGTSIAHFQPAAGMTSLGLVGMPFDDDGGLNSGSLALLPIFVP